MVNYIFRIKPNDKFHKLLLYNERVPTQLKYLISQDGGLALASCQTLTHPLTQLLSPLGQGESRRKVRRLTD